MKEFSLGLYLPMASRDMDAGKFLSQLTDEARAAEAAGLDLVLVPEHHSGPPESLGDPMSLTAWLLSQTSTIQVGPGVLLLPLYHPIHVAEWSSFLQRASGNRLVIGVGTGYQREDFELFDVDRSQRVERFERVLAEVRGGWRGNGRPPVIPHLDRHDEPPVWIGAWSRRGVARAARSADAWLVDPMRRVDEIATLGTTYRQDCADAGTDPQIVIIREMWVDETDDEACETYLPVVTPVISYYQRNGALRDASGPIDALVRERVLCGSPEHVAAGLVALAEATGATRVVGTLRHPGGPDHEQVQHAIGLLGSEVLPKVRAALASGKNSRS